MTSSFRKTRIIATLGPATESPERLRDMILAGTNIFRLNMSHAHHDWVRSIVPTIRTLSRELGKTVGILMDTQGPAVRTGDVPEKIHLEKGDLLEFRVHGATAKEKYSVDVNYDGLIDDVNEGDLLLVDNGVIHIKVLSKKENRICSEVIAPGPLGSRRHINLPGIKVNLPPLTEKDLADLALGCELGVDFMALSFCRQPSDITAMREAIKAHGGTAKIISKIEDQSAIRTIDEIIEETDSIMIARGDLGVECPMEELPIIQRRIMKRCLQLGRPVIVATHLLESMIENPVPTRAEVTDVANAVFEQADSIMLSGESTVGKYPIGCVEVMDKVASRIEKSGHAPYAKQIEGENIYQKLARSGVALANSLPNANLVVFTKTGRMADYVSQLRPEKAPIFSVTASELLQHQLILNWGTYPILMPTLEKQSHQANIDEIQTILSEQKLINEKAQLVILSDLTDSDENVRAIELRSLE